MFVLGDCLGVCDFCMLSRPGEYRPRPIASGSPRMPSGIAAGDAAYPSQAEAARQMNNYALHV